ncbi:MAG: MBL fold metallo-hydrolase [Rhodospirillales bacterium]|nr:MBL fold metallo-hydrolase [Rhodospirillales bacterium]
MLFDGLNDTANAAIATPRARQRPKAHPAALRLCVLGSGSGGNSTVVQCGSHTLLIDAGFGPRTTSQRLEQAGLTLAEVDAIILTHLDQDHFRKVWPRHLKALGIRIYLHEWHRRELNHLDSTGELESTGLVHCFDGEAFEPCDGLSVSTVRLQHDRQGTIGYRLDVAGGSGGSIGYATDLGHAPPRLIEHFAGVDLLCIEANYDEHMTMASSRPVWVNRRNLSDSGHLSNEQAFGVVQAIAARSSAGLPRHVLLMHRSSQCNHPTKLRRVFERDEALAKRITLAEQRKRTRWFNVQPMWAMQRAQLQWAF